VHLKVVLAAAIKQGGTNVERLWLVADGKPGYFKQGN